MAETTVKREITDCVMRNIGSALVNTVVSVIVGFAIGFVFHRKSTDPAMEQQFGAVETADENGFLAVFSGYGGRV